MNAHLRPTSAAASVLAGLLGIVLATGCRPHLSSATKAPAGPDDWLTWQAKRRESLAGSNGWTTLVARHWLPEGNTSVGSHPTNALVLPRGRAPEQAGQFARDGGQVTFVAAPGVDARVDGQRVQRVALASDRSNSPTRLVIGPLTMTVLERGSRVGIRVRDPESPARRQFRGIDYFPYDGRWKIPGRYRPFPAPRTMKVGDILGGTQELASPGTIEFMFEGHNHQLEVVEEPGESEFFVMFRDLTAGKSTYPTGRFLYVARPEADGRVWIDFNRAYTPPCGYTAFAVCPLPPPGNELPFAVTAGERKPAGHGSAPPP